jgi:hypothetical protein
MWSSCTACAHTRVCVGDDMEEGNKEETFFEEDAGDGEYEIKRIVGYR